MKRLTACILMTILLCALSTNFTLAAKMGKVHGSYINVREEANHASKVLDKKLRGDAYEILFDNGDGWLKVKFSDGTQGWIFNSVVEKQLAKSEEEKGDLKTIATETKTVAPLASETHFEAGVDVDKFKTAKAAQQTVATATESRNIEEKIQKTPESSPVKKTEKPNAAQPPKKTSSESPTTKKSEKPKEEKKDESSPAASVETKPKSVAQKKTMEKEEASAKTVATSKSAEQYYHEAIELYDKRRYQEALEANRAALAQAPRNPEILNNIANCLFKMGKIQEAIEKWKEALQIAPKQAKICNNLGIAYYQLDENNKAIEFYKKAILFDPQFADAYYNLASVYGFMGRFQDALDNYNKYLEFKPDPTMRKLTEERIEYCQKQLDLMKDNVKKADKPKKTEKAKESNNKTETIQKNNETTETNKPENSTAIATETQQIQ